jgi:hypothetical protein
MDHFPAKLFCGLGNNGEFKITWTINFFSNLLPQKMKNKERNKTFLQTYRTITNSNCPINLLGGNFSTVDQ